MNPIEEHEPRKINIEEYEPRRRTQIHKKIQQLSSRYEELVQTSMGNDSLAIACHRHQWRWLLFFFPLSLPLSSTWFDLYELNPETQILEINRSAIRFRVQISINDFSGANLSRESLKAILSQADLSFFFFFSFLF